MTRGSSRLPLRADPLIGEIEMREKRRTPRAHLDIYLNKYVGGIPYMARASDISPQGVRVAHLIEPQHNGKQVGLQFQLPGSTEVIYAEGEIVREWMLCGRRNCPGMDARQRPRVWYPVHRPSRATSKVD